MWRDEKSVWIYVWVYWYVICIWDVVVFCIISFEIVYFWGCCVDYFDENMYGFGIGFDINVGLVWFEYIFYLKVVLVSF